MKNYIIFAFVLLLACLAGCVNEVYVAPNQDVIVFGDSNSCGFGEKMAPEYAGILNDCLIGRSIHDIEDLPEKDLVFLELGINGPRSEQEFTDQLNSLLASTSAVVVCVLPVALDEREYMPRAVMIANCVEYLDPYEAGIVIQASWRGNVDGVHYTDGYSQQNMGAAYTETIERILGGS